MATVEILAVGTELLVGDVLDTNSNWLCRQLTPLGAAVLRMAVVRDDPEAIVRELRSGLERKADLIFITGGLGPTADDRTLEAVGRALGLPLERNESAAASVEKQYKEFAREGFVQTPALTPEREKMAILPRGAMPLSNPVGAAPGVLLRAGETSVLCLPGVPAELRGIFESSLQPFLRGTLGKGGFVEQAGHVECGDESRLSPLLRAVADAHPRTYIKSHPHRFGADVRIRVTVSATAGSRDEAARLVDEGWVGLARTLAESGLRVTPEVRNPSP